MPDPKYYYAALGVKHDCTAQEIHTAYRKLARVLHPDIPGTGNADAFVPVHEAYRVLSDPAAREEYDRASWVDYLTEEDWDTGGGLKRPVGWQDVAGGAAGGGIFQDVRPEVPIYDAQGKGKPAAPVDAWSILDTAQESSSPANSSSGISKLPFVVFGVALVALGGVVGYWFTQERDNTAIIVLNPTPTNVSAGNPHPAASTASVAASPSVAPPAVAHPAPVAPTLPPVAPAPEQAVAAPPTAVAAAAPPPPSATPVAVAATAPASVNAGCQTQAAPANASRLEGPVTSAALVAGGHSVLVVNTTDSAAVFALVSTGASAATYVAPHSFSVIDKLPDRKWRIHYATGDGWSNNCFRFMSNMKASRLPDAPLQDSYWLPASNADPLPQEQFGR